MEYTEEEAYQRFHARDRFEERYGAKLDVLTLNQIVDYIKAHQDCVVSTDTRGRQTCKINVAAARLKGVAVPYIFPIFNPKENKILTFLPSLQPVLKSQNLPKPKWVDTEDGAFEVGRHNDKIKRLAIAERRNKENRTRYVRQDRRLNKSRFPQDKR